MFCASMYAGALTRSCTAELHAMNLDQLRGVWGRVKVWRDSIAVADNPGDVPAWAHDYTNRFEVRI